MTPGMRITHLDPPEIKQLLPQLQAINENGGSTTFDFLDGTDIFACFENDHLLGYGGVACYDGQWTLRNCVVAPAGRGRGIQRLLIEARKEHVRSAGGSNLGAGIHPENRQSLANAIACGFVRKEGADRTFHGITYWWMVCDLEAKTLPAQCCAVSRGT